MSKRGWFPVLFLGFFLIAFPGCGNSDTPGGKEKSGKMSPESLGKAVADIYIQTITRAGRLMEPGKEVGVLKPELEKLRKEAVTELVKLGRIRETLNPADRKKPDGFISRGISAIPRDIYDSYNKGYQYYAALDRETGNLIAGFNIITQYAIFELLKKQNPGEAQRLGIE